jgi:hypothetical protein
VRHVLELAKPPFYRDTARRRHSILKFHTHFFCFMADMTTEATCCKLAYLIGKYLEVLVRQALQRLGIRVQLTLKQA